MPNGLLICKQPVVILTMRSLVHKNLSKNEYKLPKIIYLQKRLVMLKRLKKLQFVIITYWIDIHYSIMTYTMYELNKVLISSEIM